MTRSWLTIPHGAVSALADVGNLVAYRRAHPEMTFTPIFAAALVRALNVEVHLGIAVAAEDGLIVPVLHGADATDFEALAKKVEDLVERARTRRLKPEEMSGGTFSLTNLGVFGALHSQPIVPEGHAGILGVGAIQPRAMAIDGLLAVRPSAYLSLIFDRRHLDEPAAADLLASIVRELAAVV